MTLEPEIAIGQADATPDRIDKDFDSALRISTRHSDAAQAATGDAFPTGVAELAAERKSMFEAIRCGGQITVQQIDFGTQRQRPRHERGPTLLRQRDRAIECVGRRREVAVKQQGTPQHRQPVGNLFRVAGAVAERHGVPQHRDRSFIVRGIAEYRSVHGFDARLLGAVATGKR